MAEETTNGAGIASNELITLHGADESVAPLLAEFVRTFFDEEGNFLQEMDDGDVVVFVLQTLEQQINDLDQEIEDQLNEILHHDAFQRLEASWRGLYRFVMETETGPMLKLRLMNITKDELYADLDKAVDFDQSSLFKKVYEEEYGTLGGKPYGLLVGDYAFNRSARDINMLELIANVASAAHAPFLASADPALFDLKSFTELPIPRDLSKIFEAVDMAPWREFRNSEDSRYVSLLMPRVLQRLPYDPENFPAEGINFTEDVDGRDHGKYLWGNPAYILAGRITNAFSLFSWCAAIRGVEGGGRVSGLPTHTFRSEDGDTVMKCPTEVSITDRREKELSDLGFISIVHCKNEAYAAIFGGQTVNKPKKYMTDQATANARLSASLPYIIAASRFAHYIKVNMRDKIGRFMSRSNVENYLNDWIAHYVLLSDDATQSEKSRYPLREARVDVTADPARPGCYNATVFLRPHFQLEELTASIRLVAELPPPGAAAEAA